ncbi:hypothetical protein TREMEDRAFT_39940 [Tremella mesenterica DSM 1558]|uniref:uncharacterized protein n=1 Tax=Tremella mesenterica (strain ATCC 24925 / CBS 8224 / DSM 1558 / NBRC 9311 / NRRL Y-6157 / RJB 2259-6 / UBC 559-6) TaxID=578456 RepID=UPI0003F49639|nr:uncharacterized protein TREMEDRAFT_39940 [Tremella mesenterica DSM 1558]EIW67797.1 hypothetical protein TREMEDRAFT_39940 [Tremella mesenterica DSM 1558]
MRRIILASALPFAFTLAAHSPLRQERHRQLARANAPAGGFQDVGQSGVSAQMIFLGTENTIFILDKAENNEFSITTNGTKHPAWGARYDLRTNTPIAMEVTANTFCACGSYMADGRMAVFGGNQPVTYNGTAVNDKFNNPSGTNPYMDLDGGAAVRILNPCDGENCDWEQGGADLTMAAHRWYPTVEPMGDGSLCVMGGDHNGGYVSTFAQNEASYEFFPKQPSGAIPMDFLNRTVPINLFPLSWLMPNGQMFMQAAYETIMYDFDSKTEIPLPQMPYAVRVYPASAAAVMLPLTPANNYEPTILFCGGSSAPFNKSSDGGANFNVTAYAADDTCVRIRPMDEDPQYVDDDNLPEPRSMGSLVFLPDGKLWLGNGVGMGTAGYGNEGYSIGQSYGQDPVYTPVLYDPDAPLGSRFNRDGLSPSQHERMYHSTALLLPDGSIILAGSNPRADVSYDPWPTSYSVERWYPHWYNLPRPEPSGFPSSLTYGGEAWNLTYTPTNSSSDPNQSKVVVIRTGFATHGVNWGQKYLELNSTYTKDGSTGEVMMHVSQMPPNANLFQPGPVLIFLVVDGIPSVGSIIMVGSGQIETQPILPVAELPQSQVVIPDTSSTSNNSSDGSTSTGGLSASNAAGRSLTLPSVTLTIIPLLFALLR